MKQIRLAKSGENALTATDPNDFIFHSGYNTFKILKQGKATITYSSDGGYTIAHGLSSYSPTSFASFIKFPDGYTIMTAGTGAVLSRNENWLVRDVYIDSTNIGMYIDRLGGSETSLTVAYYIFETPL